MTGTGPELLAGALGRALRRLGVSGRVEQETLRAEWSACVGEGIAAHAEPGSLRKGRLCVVVDSAAWAHRLAAAEAARIRDGCNRVLGRNAVRDVHFRVGSMRGKEREQQDAAS